MGIKNLFKKKEKNEILFFGRCYEIVYTQEAVAKGIYDDYQKEIIIMDKKVWIEDGKLKTVQKIVEKISYSPAEIESIEKVYKIPGVDRTEDYGEEFTPNEVLSLAGIFKRREPRVV